MKLGFNMEFLSNPQRCKYLNLIIPSLLWLWPPLPRFPTQRNLHQAWWWTLDISVHRAFGAGSARFPWVFRSWCWKKSGDHQLKLVVYPIIYSQFFFKIPGGCKISINCRKPRWNITNQPFWLSHVIIAVTLWNNFSLRTSSYSSWHGFKAQIQNNQHHLLKISHDHVWHRIVW